MVGKDMISLCAVGDIVAFHKNPESAFEYVGPILREADITFAQNERLYSRRKDICLRGGEELTTPENARFLKLGGFDVISFASNHSMDLGAEVMLETANVLKALGFAVIGVGSNILEARKPAIIERGGTNVAFLGYSSVLRAGCSAEPRRAGCAPMRAWTLYNQIDYQPGTPPQIITFPYRDDLDALLEDVRQAKTQADLVVLSLHWGIHFYHAVIATYQKEVAHAAIEAGADIILGHHAHQLKAVEVYKGKPIFYSLGNFAFDLPYQMMKDWVNKSEYVANLLSQYGWVLDPEWDLYAFPPESRKSIIAKFNIADKKLQGVRFLPVLINQKAQPKVICRSDKTFDEMVQYIKDITISQQLDTQYSIQGDEVVVPLT